MELGQPQTQWQDGVIWDELLCIRVRGGSVAVTVFSMSGSGEGSRIGV